MAARYPAAFPGELVVGGAPVGRGYINAPAVTAETFGRGMSFALPGGRSCHTGDRGRQREDGTFEVLGRIDDQIKINGLRVEPREIEATIAEHEEVSLVAVRDWEEASGAKYLCVYVVPRPGVRVDLGVLRAVVADRLPRHCVPTVWRLIETLPLNGNGKVVRKRLPHPVERTDVASAPSGDHLVAAVVHHWQRALGPAADAASS